MLRKVVSGQRRRCAVRANPNGRRRSHPLRCGKGKIALRQFPPTGSAFDEVLDVLHLDRVQLQAVLKQGADQSLLRGDRATLLEAKLGHEQEGEGKDDRDGVAAKRMFKHGETNVLLCRRR